MEGLKKITEDLGVKDFKELTDYINNPENKDEKIVKDFKELFEFYLKIRVGE